ncbi:leucine-rich repeats and immunoglobulin-like domains protein 1 isoform X4 [Hydra vulgaris]|uniref:leucine-rich repeats and immunoglobulin-like domains protein 1 isoform X4 n=1 Tax=Hydra vulgaris TaxID=6087 RepID=UPI001F5ED9B5|nr:leucine-rich repeats and immunoglobulin-like domains protein 1 isoform X4 [Hydra vulgaris]
MWLTQYLVLFCCVYADPCPNKCVCHSSWIRGITTVVVDCSKQGLAVVPSRISPYVTSLVLNENFITELPANSFTKYKHLRELFLYKNFISKIHKDAFNGLQKLTELSLHSNRLTFFENGTFSSLKNLRRLYLFTNYIKSIDNGVFQGLDKVETLFLHENLLRTIPEGTFAHMEQLQILTLYRNYLQVLFNGSLKGMFRLNTLYLQENKLKVIENGSFSECVNLKKLQHTIIFFSRQLAHNHLTSITKDMFTGTKVSEIYLEYNRLKEITTSSFGNLPFIKKIVLLGNQINSIQNKSFSLLSSLMVLSLSGNHLTELKVGMFSGLTSVSQLFLQENQIEWIEKKTFADMRNLQQLFLFRNQIFYIQEKTFEGLTSLSELNLGVNNISGLANGAFDGLPRLLVLQINSNRLTTIPSRAFRNLRSLYRLVIFFNSISFIEEGSFDHFERLRSIVWYAPLSLAQSSRRLRLIKSNNLQCDCNILWLKTWLNKRNVNTTIFCEKPDFLSGKDISSINASLFKCENPDKMLVTVLPKSVILLQGSTLFLKCNSNVVSNFTWLKDGVLLLSSDSLFQMTSGILYIKSIQRTSAGHYTCIATNKQWSGVAFSKVSIGIRATILSPKNETFFIESDQSITLQCNATGAPIPSRIWFKNDVSFIYTNNSVLNFNGDLHIFKLTSADVGVYKCEVNNDFGFDSKTINLLFKHAQLQELFTKKVSATRYQKKH